MKGTLSISHYLPAGVLRIPSAVTLLPRSRFPLECIVWSTVPRPCILISGTGVNEWSKVPAKPSEPTAKARLRHCDSCQSAHSALFLPPKLPLRTSSPQNTPQWDSATGRHNGGWIIEAFVKATIIVVGKRGCYVFHLAVGKC